MRFPPSAHSTPPHGCAAAAQGCSEIRWLAEKMHAKPTTISGLSGARCACRALVGMLGALAVLGIASPACGTLRCTPRLAACIASMRPEAGQLGRPGCCAVRAVAVRAAPALRWPAGPCRALSLGCAPLRHDAPAPSATPAAAPAARRPWRHHAHLLRQPLAQPLGGGAAGPGRAAGRHPGQQQPGGGGGGHCRWAPLPLSPPFPLLSLLAL